MFAVIEHLHISPLILTLYGFDMFMVQTYPFVDKWLSFHAKVNEYSLYFAS